MAEYDGGVAEEAANEKGMSAQQSGDLAESSPSAAPSNASKVPEPIPIEKPSSVILDFHGTTTPITLVKDVLLPYIKNNIERYLRDHWDSKRLQRDLDHVRKELRSVNRENPFKIRDKNAPDEEIQKSVADFVKWYVEHGKEQESMLKLMKHVWHEAYDNGWIQTPVYEDVAIAIAKWKEDDIKVYMYSSNKVEAQKQFFKRTDRGSLLEYIDGHFDKAVGPKDSSTSYAKISQELGQPAGRLLYISDSVKEAKAASKVGLHAVLIHRKGNRAISEREKKNFPFIHSFLELNFS